MKCFVLDTNIIVDDPEALNNFDGRLKILPITVIEELDRLKRGVEERAINSRKASRIIKDALDTNRGDIVVLVENDLDVLDVKLEMMALDPDDLILLYYQAAVDKYKDEYDEVVLVTNDNNMFIKAKSYGFSVENVKRHTVEPTSDLEVKTITLPEHEFDQIAAGKIHIEASNYMSDFYNNQYIIIASEYSTKQTLLGKVFNGRILMLNPMHQEGYSGIKPKNKEQRFLFDALGESHIDCVIVNGASGSGKTLCAMATGLAKIMNERKSFDRMIITKPTYSIDMEIGHLPGSLEEKMLPHLTPFQDNLDFITKRMKLKDMKGIQENGLVEIMSLSFIRGRSIMDAFVIADEIQNIPPSTLKTLVSRMSDSSKLILLGDVSQIDNPSLNKQYNGLSYAISKLKGYDNIACLQMTKSFRSRLTQIAVDVL